MIQSVMSSQEKAAAAQWVEAENKKLSLESGMRTTLPNQNLGKDDFLKILLTQLAHQDPTAPMQDKEFIAQMAQFSSLEQMTNMAADFSRMARMLRNSEASGALGKTVEISLGDNTVHGVVQAITREEMPQILVNGRYYHWENVTSIYEQQAVDAYSRGE